MTCAEQWCFVQIFKTEKNTKMKNTLIVILTFCALSAFAQSNPPIEEETKVADKYRIRLPGITLPQLITKSWNDRKNTQHIELHVKRNLDEIHCSV